MLMDFHYILISMLRSISKMRNKTAALIEHINSLIKDYPDFPQPGILFKDICPALHDPWVLRNVANNIVANVPEFDKIMVLESRGFIIGSVISVLHNKPIVLARKKGKLPGECHSVDYSLEYGKTQVLEAQVSCGIGPDDRVLIHYDVLATGGTALAAKRLVEMLGANVTGYGFLAQIDFLKGHLLLGENTYSVI